MNDCYNEVQRVLILTSSLGSGHVRGGQAVEAALAEHYPQVEVKSVDFWWLMDGLVAASAKQRYLDLVQDSSDKYEHIFQMDGDGIQSAMANRAALTPEQADGFRLLAEPELDLTAGREGEVDSSLDRMLFRVLRWGFPGRRQRDTIAAMWARRLAILVGQWRMSRRLEQIIDDFAPQSIVITQPLPAALISLIKKRRELDIPVFGVLLNWGVIDFYNQSAIDFHCVPHALMAGLDQLQPYSVTGCPLMPGFSQPPTKLAARLELGLDPEKPVVVVQGGGLGIHTIELARTLLCGTERLQIMVQAGSNRRALATLRELSAQYGDRLRVSEWTDRMDLSLSAADVVVGKPGGLTLGECLACGRPLLATGSTGGQETLNIDFLERNGVGWRTCEERLVDDVQALLHDSERLAEVEARAWALGERHGAEQVAKFVVTHSHAAIAPAP